MAQRLTIKCPLALLLSQLLSQVGLHPPTRHYATSQVYPLHRRLCRLRLRCGRERPRRNNHQEGIIHRQPAMQQPMPEPCGLLHWMRVCLQHTGRACIDHCSALRVTNWGWNRDALLGGWPTRCTTPLARTMTIVRSEPGATRSST